MQVIKRDGRIVSFDKSKITDAILKAMDSVGEVNTRTASRIANEISKMNYDKLNIEEIQDIVENKLMKSSYPDVAKAYIKYREERSKERNRKSHFMRTIKNKISGSDIQNQNANVDEMSFGGRKGEASNELMKSYALDYIVSPMARNNHLENRIYIHDLDSYAVGMHNCLSIPFDNLLAKGFNTRQTDVRPANSVNTAFQLVAVIFQLQSLQQFGGVAATHLDWTMVPYVKKSFMKHYVMAWLKDTQEFLGLNIMEMVFDNYEEHIEDDLYILHNKFEDWVDEHKKEFFNKTGLTLEDFYFDNDKLDKKYAQSAMLDTFNETKQAIEGMYHNLNTLQSRSGNQLPFTSINYGTCTSTEGRLITKALLEVLIEGNGALHKTSIFPCGIFQCMKGVNRKPGEPNYDLFRLALKATARRLYPNYANVDWSANKGYDRNDPRTYFSTMGCRTANLFDINGLGQLKDGRGNICPVTIILPTLAMEAKKQFLAEYDDSIIELFMQMLDKAIFDAKEMLLERFDFICEQPPESAKFMYENGVMVGYEPDEGTFSALKHGTLALGQLGLAECLQILIGKDHTTDEGMELAKRIEQLFKTRCAEFKEQEKLNFGVYYTPAENLCYTAMKKFQNKYGTIKNISDHEYFTNSMHVPVWKEMSPFEKIDIESQLTGYSSAGCITYVELEGEVLHNIDALEQLVNYAMDKDIPYFAINVPNDMCTTCGYTGLIDSVCPKCGGRKIQRLRRVTGYLTGDYKTAFNLGKQQEVEQRYKHSKKLRGFI